MAVPASESASNDAEKMRLLDGLLAEYNFVTALIPMYRRIENQSITALGVTVGAVGSVFAALSGGESETAQSLTRGQLGIVMALLSWIFLIFLSVQITAMLRIRRANRYIVKYLYPRLAAVAPGLFEELRTDFRVGFETVPSLELIHPKESETTKIQRSIGQLLITSGATTLGLSIGGVVAGIGAVVLTVWNDNLGVADACVMVSAVTSGSLLLLLGRYGYRVSSGNERVRTA